MEDWCCCVGFGIVWDCLGLFGRGGGVWEIFREGVVVGEWGKEKSDGRMGKRRMETEVEVEVDLIRGVQRGELIGLGGGLEF